MKRLLDKAMLGSKIASFMAALQLIKEELSDTFKLSSNDISLLIEQVSSKYDILPTMKNLITEMTDTEVPSSLKHNIKNLLLAYKAGIETEEEWNKAWNLIINIDGQNVERLKAFEDLLKSLVKNEEFTVNLNKLLSEMAGAVAAGAAANSAQGSPGTLAGINDGETIVRDTPELLRRHPDEAEARNRREIFTRVKITFESLGNEDILDEVIMKKVDDKEDVTDIAKNVNEIVDEIKEEYPEHKLNESKEIDPVVQMNSIQDFQDDGTGDESEETLSISCVVLNGMFDVSSKTFNDILSIEGISNKGICPFEKVMNKLDIEIKDFIRNNPIQPVALVNSDTEEILIIQRTRANYA